MLKFCDQDLKFLHLLKIFVILFVYILSIHFQAIYHPSYDTIMKTSDSPSNQQDESTKFPCGTCDRTVTWEERGVACESCGLWYHASCQSIKTQTYFDLDDSNVIWNCRICGSPNYSTHPFDLHDIEKSPRIHIFR